MEHSSLFDDEFDQLKLFFGMISIQLKIFSGGILDQHRPTRDTYTVAAKIPKYERRFLAKKGLA